jgi:DNA-nicking Smr family endonuclease
MSKKKQPKDFRNTPFKNVQGVSVCKPSDSDAQAGKVPPRDPSSTGDDFFAQMTQLGVQPLAPGGEQVSSSSVGKPPAEALDHKSDRQLFLDSLGSFDATFQDEVPEPARRPAQPSRMKLLQRGKLEIEATLDLHGLTRREALERVGYFLENASFHQLQTVLIVTGKGTHSAGEAVLRSAVEEDLRDSSHPAILEWGRAPREHGGEGALVVFLRSAGR